MEKNLLLPDLERFFNCPFIKTLNVDLMDEESRNATMNLISSFTIVKGCEKHGAPYEVQKKFFD